MYFKSLAPNTNSYTPYSPIYYTDLGFFNLCNFYTADIQFTFLHSPDTTCPPRLYALTQSLGLWYLRSLVHIFLI
jgi:hypothetical protein